MILSIIVPIYNVESYLTECINSLLNIKNRDVEFVLINDESSDNSFKIMQLFSLRDSRIKIHSISNRGCSGARNYGISVAEGDYLMFLDGDDWIDASLVDDLLTMVDPKIDVYRFDYVKENGKNSEIITIPFLKEKKYFESNISIVKRKLVSLTGDDKRYMDYTNALSSSCFCLYKKNIIDINHLMFLTRNEIPIYNDFFFNLDFLSKINSFEYVNLPIYHYRRNNITSSTRTSKKHFCDIQLLFLRLLNDRLNLQTLKKEILVRFFYLWFELVLNYADNSDVKYALREIKKYKNTIKMYGYTKKIRVCNSMLLKWKILYLLYYLNLDYVALKIIKHKKRSQHE